MPQLCRRSSLPPCPEREVRRIESARNARAALPSDLGETVLNSRIEGIMAKGPLSGKQAGEYHANGYVLVKGLFDAQEIGLRRRAGKEDRQLDQHSFGMKDGEGG